MEALVSIIIPVFNAEEYLDKCIQSVLSQSYKNWELILVNDGSTDNSGMICDKFAKTDSRIHYIQKDNTGVADTRNLGLNHTKGDYIMFLDSDDYWRYDNVIDTLVKKAIENELDIIRGNYVRIDEDNNELEEDEKNIINKKYHHKTISSIEFQRNILCIGGYYLWVCLFKKEVIKNFRFKKEWNFLEDMEFFSNLLTNPLRCMHIDYYFYTYNNNNKSLVHTKSIKNLLDSIRMCYSFYNYSSNIKNLEIKSFYLTRVICLYYSTLRMLTEDNQYYCYRKEIIDDFGILQKHMRNWICESDSERIIYDPVLNTPIYIYIKYWRLRHYIKQFYNNINCHAK